VGDSAINVWSKRGVLKAPLEVNAI